MSARRLTPDSLRAALAAPREAHGPDPLLHEGTKPAGVVLPVRFEPGLVAFAVLRASTLIEHAGEVGFPGGKPEPHDVDLWATATREAEEEVGVPASALTLLGTLTPVPVITGRFLIHPHVATLAPGVEPTANSGEVERVLTLPLGEYLTGTRRYSGVVSEWRDGAFPLPFFPVGDHVLYGASAVIFYELLQIAANALGVPLPEPLPAEHHPWGARY